MKSLLADEIFYTSGALTNQISFIFILNAPSMDGKADAASHGDAVYQRDVRNPTRTRQMVELQKMFKFQFIDMNKSNLLMPDIPLERSLPGRGCPWRL